MAFAGVLAGSLSGYFVQITPSPSNVDVLSLNSVTVTETISGVRTGDFVFTIVSPSVDSKLIYSSPYASSDDTVKYRISNLSSGTISAPKVNTFFVLKINNADDGA